MHAYKMSHTGQLAVMNMVVLAILLLTLDCFARESSVGRLHESLFLMARKCEEKTGVRHLTPARVPTGCRGDAG